MLLRKTIVKYSILILFCIGVDNPYFRSETIRTEERRHMYGTEGVSHLGIKRQLSSEVLMTEERRGFSR